VHDAAVARERKSGLVPDPHSTYLKLRSRAKQILKAAVKVANLGSQPLEQRVVLEVSREVGHEENTMNATGCLSTDTKSWLSGIQEYAGATLASVQAVCYVVELTMLVAAKHSQGTIAILDRIIDAIKDVQENIVQHLAVIALSFCPSCHSIVNLIEAAFHTLMKTIGEIEPKWRNSKTFGFILRVGNFLLYLARQICVMANAPSATNSTNSSYRVEEKVAVRWIDISKALLKRDKNLHIPKYFQKELNDPRNFAHNILTHPGKVIWKGVEWLLEHALAHLFQNSTQNNALTPL